MSGAVGCKPTAGCVLQERSIAMILGYERVVDLFEGLRKVMELLSRKTHRISYA